MAYLSDPNVTVNEEMDQFSFSDFPEDVQLSVLSFLAPSEVATFACTSKRFLSLCRSDSKLWFALCHRRWGSKTQIAKWGHGKVTYRQLYKTLNEYENFLGFWWGSAQGIAGVASPLLVFLEWDSSFVVGSMVSPSKTGTYQVVKTPFLWLSVMPDGSPLSFLDPDYGFGSAVDVVQSGEFSFRENEFVAVNVNFVGKFRIVVEENMNFGYSERREKGKKLDPRCFWKIINSEPTPSRPLQGLWKGISDGMTLEFYLIAYYETGAVSCWSEGNSTHVHSRCVFWTSNTNFIKAPFSHGEESLYNNRMHLQPFSPGMASRVVTHTLRIKSGVEMVFSEVAGPKIHPEMEGRIWRYSDGAFGFGFISDNYITDLKPIAQDGCVL